VISRNDEERVFSRAMAYRAILLTPLSGRIHRLGSAATTVMRVCTRSATFPGMRMLR